MNRIFNVWHQTTKEFLEGSELLQIIFIDWHHYIFTYITLLDLCKRYGLALVKTNAFNNDSQWNYMLFFSRQSELFHCNMGTLYIVLYGPSHCDYVVGFWCCTSSYETYPSGGFTDTMTTLIATFMGPTWGPSVAERTQVGPMLAPWTLLSGNITALMLGKHPGRVLAKK